MIYLTLVLQPMCIDFMFQKITTSHALSSQPEYQQVIVNVDITSYRFIRTDTMCTLCPKLAIIIAAQVISNIDITNHRFISSNTLLRLKSTSQLIT